MSNPLDAIRDRYLLTQQCVRVVARVVRTGAKKIIQPKHTFLVGVDVATAERLAGEAEEHLDRLTVLDLTSAFERYLRLHVLYSYHAAFAAGTPRLDAIHGELKKDIEFWNVSERLLTLFSGVDAVVRGNVKQVIDYRNWVAHGKWADQLLSLTTNPTHIAPKPNKISPEQAYDRLTAFLTQAGLVA